MLEDFEIQEGDVQTKLVDGIPSYLTVRPWSPDLLTTQVEVGIQVVWVCLPDVSKSYYSISLLKVIGQAIRSVVRIDENNDSVGFMVAGSTYAQRNDPSAPSSME
ncbi:hypothetical protein Golax_022148 [Gossypium laxum]|uniref:DUF4283 domain-containing protein n=1 Tax=Gossypium laxum TaxID=34288 RepID=A0A7J9AQ57_9ROSI|nr:hypothetical protein [Gossypium laxum]